MFEKEQDLSTCRFFACRSTDAGVGLGGKQGSGNSIQMEELLRENQVLRSAVQCLADYLPEDVKSELAGVSCSELLSHFF